MAERWQQWMPFHIDKFRGSPEVQAMHPAARLGYIYLLASAWQSSDCTVANDPLDLATESGLGDELWALYGPRILRKFEVVGDRLRNLVLFAEWSEALKVYEKRKSGAVRTNSSRSASDERTQSSRNTDTGTGTETTTGTKTEIEAKAKAKAKTLALTPVGVPAERSPAKRPKREPNPMHTVFKGLVLAAWTEWGNDFEAPWDAAEGKQLGMLMGANPKLGPDGMRRLLQYRARSSGVNLSERPCKWLRTLTDYGRGPLNQFKQPEVVNGANHSNTLGNRKADAANTALANVQARRAARIAEIEAGNGTCEDGSQSGRVDGRDSIGVLLGGSG